MQIYNPIRSTRRCRCLLYKYSAHPLCIDKRDRHSPICHSMGRDNRCYSSTFLRDVYVLTDLLRDIWLDCISSNIHILFALYSIYLLLCFSFANCSTFPYTCYCVCFRDRITLHVMVLIFLGHLDHIKCHLSCCQRARHDTCCI